MNINLIDEHQTATIAKVLASHLPRQLVIYLSGDLGSGKTTLVRYLLQAILPKTKVKSPTFTLLETYSLQDRVFYHFDLYRLNTPAELDYMGIRDYFSHEAVSLIEWPEKGYSFLPEPDVVITLSLVNHHRLLTIASKTDQGHLFLKACCSDPNFNLKKMESKDW